MYNHQAPLYVEQLAVSWKILLFVIGLVLIALEIFVIPGFGVAGISGIVAVVASLSFAMIDNTDLLLRSEGMQKKAALSESYALNRAACIVKKPDSY